MKTKESIYEWQGNTIVAFGRGAIQIGFAKDDLGQVEVHLADVMRENPIGLDMAKWEGAKGRSVILGFNKVESIDVLIKGLEEARAALAADPKGPGHD